MTAPICPACGTRMLTDGCPACESGTAPTPTMVSMLEALERVARSDERRKAEAEVLAMVLSLASKFGPGSACANWDGGYQTALTTVVREIVAGAHRSKP